MQNGDSDTDQKNIESQVGRGCRIHLLHLVRGVSVLDMKSNNLMVWLH